MNYRPGDAYTIEFTTSDPTTFASRDADTLPVAIANRNGTDDGAFVLTVTKLDTGRYKATGTVPAYSGGDVVNVTAQATVGGITGKLAIDVFMIERTVELPSPAPAGYGPGGGSGTTAVTHAAGGTGRSPSDMTVTNGSQPIMGAVVEAYLTSTYTANPATATAIASTATDVNGHWTLNLPNGATYTLVFSYPGDSTATGSVTV